MQEVKYKLKLENNSSNFFYMSNSESIAFSFVKPTTGGFESASTIAGCRDVLLSNLANLNKRDLSNVKLMLTFGGAISDEYSMYLVNRSIKVLNMIEEEFGFNKTIPYIVDNKIENTYNYILDIDDDWLISMPLLSALTWIIRLAVSKGDEIDVSSYTNFEKSLINIKNNYYFIYDEYNLCNNYSIADPDDMYEYEEYDNPEGLDFYVEDYTTTIDHALGINTGCRQRGKFSKLYVLLKNRKKIFNEDQISYFVFEYSNDKGRIYLIAPIGIRKFMTGNFTYENKHDGEEFASYKCAKQTFNALYLG